MYDDPKDPPDDEGNSLSDFEDAIDSEIDGVDNDDDSTGDGDSDGDGE